MRGRGRDRGRGRGRVRGRGRTRGRARCLYLGEARGHGALEQSRMKRLGAR